MTENTETKKEIKILAITQNTNPPIKPSIVFLGDIFSKSLCLPIDLPTI